MKLPNLYDLHCIKVAVAVLCFMATACGKDKETQPEYPETRMAMSTSSETSTNEGAAARLFFWEEDQLPTVATTGTQPYHECKLPGKINDYSDIATKFETGIYYPQLNTRVYALGFSPYDLEQVTENNHGEYYLPYCNGEDTTTLVSNSITGSSVYPFHDTMEFRPATTQFIFRAIRSKNLSGNLYVRDITITMPDGSIPNILTWDGDNTCYKAIYDKDKDKEENPIKYTESQLSTTAYTELGRRYLVLPETRLENNTITMKGITVEAQYSYDPQFPDNYRTWMNTWKDLEIPLKDTNNTSLKTPTKPGESYLITIEFDKDEFTLYAEKQDWVYGGKIPIPVNPPSTQQ